MLVRSRKQCSRGQGNCKQSPLTIGDFRRLLQKRLDCGICLAGVSHFENEKPRRFRAAQVPKQPVDMHGRFMEKIARVVELRRIRIDLVLDVPLEHVGEDGAFVRVRPSSEPRPNREADHAHFRIGCVAERFLH